MGLNLVPLPATEMVSVPRDQWDRPLVVPRGGGKPRGMTRCTTFIDCLEDKSNLTNWGKRMVLVGAAAGGNGEHWMDEVRALDHTDKADKKKLDIMAEKCVTAAGSHDRREKGTHLHALTELVDQGLPLPDDISESDFNDMMAYKMATIDFEHLAIEEFLVTDELGVAGTADRRSLYHGPPPPGTRANKKAKIVDLKTGASQEYSGLKNAMQFAVYSRGALYDFTRFPVDVNDAKAFKAWKATEFSEADAWTAWSSPVETDHNWAITIHLAAGTGVCDLYWVDIAKGWTAAKLAYKVRETRSLSRTLQVPFAA